MMNAFLMLGPIGMILVGLLSIGIWKLKSSVSINYFILGGLVWVAAIVPKVAMDYTITPMLNTWAMTTYGLVGMLVIVGLYVGLRTGVFECGVTFLAFSESRLRRMSLDEAMAFGIGFGAFEAILLAVPSLIQIVTLIQNPSLLDLIPPAEGQIIETALSLPTWIVPAPIIERIFVLFVHIFTALLVFISVTQRKPHFFFVAFFYKSLIDALAPYLQVTLRPSISPTGAYLAEIWMVALGLIALVGTYWARKTIFRYQQQKQGFPFSLYPSSPFYSHDWSY